MGFLGLMAGEQKSENWVYPLQSNTFWQIHSEWCPKEKNIEHHGTRWEVATHACFTTGDLEVFDFVFKAHKTKK